MGKHFVQLMLSFWYRDWPIFYVATVFALDCHGCRQGPQVLNPLNMNWDSKYCQRVHCIDSYISNFIELLQLSARVLCDFLRLKGQRQPSEQYNRFGSGNECPIGVKSGLRTNAVCIS